jgi:DNA-binding CsgD family transcriptional regulator
VDDIPVLLVLAARVAEPGATNALLEQVLQDTAALQLVPDPLSEGAVTHLVRAEIDAAADAEFCRACHVATGGNPFLVHELLRGARIRHIAPLASEAERVSQLATEPVARLVLGRLSRLGTAAAGLATAAAILGSDARLHHAAALAGLPEEEAVAAAQALRSAQILAATAGLRFEHPLVRAAVYEDLDPSARSRQHRRAAQLLDADGTPSGRVASHLIAADPCADPWVVKRLRFAGEEALDAGAPDAAAGYLERALEEPPVLELRPVVLYELGQALFGVNPMAAAQRLSTALLLTEDEKLRISIVFALGKALSFCDRVGECVEVLEHALREASGVEPQARLHLERELFLWAAFWADNDRRQIHTGHLRKISAGMSGVTREERAMLGLRAWDLALSSGTSSSAVHAARRAVGEGSAFIEAAPGFEIAILVCLVFVCCDEVDEGWRLLDDGINQLRSAGWLVHQTFAYSHRSHTELCRGALLDAEADARTSWQLAEQLGPGLPAWWYSIGNLIQVLVARGAVVEAAELLEGNGLGEQVPEAVIMPQPRMVRGELRIAQGRFAEGLEDVLGAGSWMEHQGFTNPPWGGWRALAASTLARCGRKDEARDIIAEAVVRAKRFGAPSGLGVALRSAGLVEDGERGIELLRESVEVLGESPARHEQAQSLVELGACLRRENRRSEARGWLHEGLKLAERCGASGLTQRARAELLATGARPRPRALWGLDALTASERRVAMMAVEGLTNVEVAQSLYVSQKTVEKHLTSVFMKLDISSRSELASTPGLQESS